MTTIGPSITITGQLTSREDMTIHGAVNGKISMEHGALLVAPGAKVEANVEVGQMTVHGRFSGDIAATGRVELTPTAVVAGTLLAPAVILQDGAQFNGEMEIQRQSKGAASRPQLAKAV